MTSDPFYLSLSLFVGLWVVIYLLIVWVAVQKYRRGGIPMWLMLLTILLLPCCLLLWPLIFEMEVRQLRKLQPAPAAPLLRQKRLIGWLVYGFVFVASAAMKSITRWTVDVAHGADMADCYTLLATLLLLVVLLLFDRQTDRLITTKQNKNV